MSPTGTASSFRLVLSDVDGTLVDSDKRLTRATVDAVGRLHDAGIAFAITSGRPPRGMEMFVGPLSLTTPMGAFNGGEFVTPDMTEIRTLDVAADLVGPIIDAMETHGMFVWLYSGTDWYVTDPEGPHVEREAATVQFQPKVVDSLVDVGPVAKIVGASDDHDAVAQAEQALRDEFCDEVSASRSQPYYLDVTHPDANKGSVVKYLAEELDIPLSSVVTLGDSPNDVLMFAHCGLSVAMGNASSDVQRSARQVTRTNDDEGFAHAIERFVFGAAPVGDGGRR